MKLFTDRHGMRVVVPPTETITVEMYSLILSCCEKYYENLSHIFPDKCPDGNICCGLNYSGFLNMILFEIPSLLRDSNNIIISPQCHYSGSEDSFNQYALLDFIEYIAQNCKDFLVEGYHSYFNHHHVSFLETNDVFVKYREEINNIFYKTRLMFTLTEQKTVERTIEKSVLTPDIENIIQTVSEVGIKQLLNESIIMFKHRDPSKRQYAVEKIWDALERLKTYYKGLDKKASLEKVLSAMSSGENEFKTLFNNEFLALTAIGNEFRIRHHETNKIDILDTKHYDYFFNRCLALIALAIEYLKLDSEITIDTEEELPF